MAFGVVQFPGTNCDHDCFHVVHDVLEQETFFLWHGDHALPSEFTNNPEKSVIILPGGFSYGDYLRCGSLASHSPLIKNIKEFAGSGGRIIGICNGFQILAEAGMLPGTLIMNTTLRFICKNVYLKVINNDSPFTSKYQINEVINMPIAHKEGSFYIEDEGLERLRENGQIAFHYCNVNGEVSPESNPNGSVDNIAGIFNKDKNVLGMMPHPERLSEKLFIDRIDGILLFKSLVTTK
ncbi:phosphoribosylformylglycinamidine synthase I [Candidatus Margulisiibacteriota bacterium]